MVKVGVIDVHCPNVHSGKRKELREMQNCLNKC